MEDVFKENKRTFDYLCNAILEYEISNFCPHTKSSAIGKKERQDACKRIVKYLGCYDLKRYYQLATNEECYSKIMALLNS